MRDTLVDTGRYCSTLLYLTGPCLQSRTAHSVSGPRHAGPLVDIGFGPLGIVLQSLTQHHMTARSVSRAAHSPTHCSTLVYLTNPCLQSCATHLLTLTRGRLFTVTRGHHMTVIVERSNSWTLHCLGCPALETRPSHHDIVYPTISPAIPPIISYYSHILMNGGTKGRLGL